MLDSGKNATLFANGRVLIGPQVSGDSTDSPSLITLDDGATAILVRDMGPRGTSIRVHRSPDGKTYEDRAVWRMTYDQAVCPYTRITGVPALGRACLQRNSLASRRIGGAAFTLYVSMIVRDGSGWGIGVLHANQLGRFRPRKICRIDPPRDAAGGVLAPWGMEAGGALRLWASASASPPGAARFWLATSESGGQSWTWRGAMVMGDTGVQEARLGSIIDGLGPAAGRSLAFIDCQADRGLRVTQLAFSDDRWRTWKTVTHVPGPPKAPRLRAPYQMAGVQDVQALAVGGEVWFVYTTTDAPRSEVRQATVHRGDFDAFMAGLA